MSLKLFNKHVDSKSKSSGWLAFIQLRWVGSLHIGEKEGFHYTNLIIQRLVKKCGLGQPMSRRGNCWDNVPQESFFGHFKDEAAIKPCETLEQLKKEIKSYMIYYNHFRYQWNLKRMTPV